MVADTQRTNVLLRNTVNEFLLLSNTQFIESRVWAEDERNKSEVKPEETAAADASATSTNAEQVIDQRYRDAIGLGLTAMSLTDFGRPPKQPKSAPAAPPEGADSAAAVEEPAASSEEEEEDTNDRFNRRPLPFVIGTEEFDEDDHVGLFDPDASDSEEKAADAQGQDSGDDEEETDTEELVPSGFVPEDATAPEVAVAGIPDSHPPHSESMTDGGVPTAAPDDFASAGPPPPAPSAADMGGQGPPVSLADELASRLGVAPSRPPPPAPAAAAAAVVDEHPEAPVSSDPFAAPSGPGANAWGASLFDDNAAAPVDIFATTSKGMFDTESIFSSSGPAPAVDIFSATVDDIFGAPAPAKTDQPKPQQSAAPPVAAADDIFGNNMFGSAPAPASVSAVKKPAPTPSADLFGEPVAKGQPAGNDIFGGFDPIVPKKEVPSAAPILATAVTAVAPPPEVTVEQSSLQAPAPAATRKPPPGAVNLFGGVDLFAGNAPGTPSMSRDRARSRSSSVSAEKKASRPSTPSNTIGDLPPSPSSAENLFGQPAPAAASAQAAAPSGPKKPAGAVSLFGGVDLFGSSPVESGGSNLFASKKPTAGTTATASSAASLFGDSGGSDLFGSSPKQGSSAAPAPAKKPAAGTGSGASLFGGSDLFGTSPQSSAVPAPAASKKPATAPSGSLFGGDDDFGGLFSAPVPAKATDKPGAQAPVTQGPAVSAPVAGAAPATEDVPAAAPPPKKGPAGAVSLFGGVDLFGGASPAVGKKDERPGPPKSSPSPPPAAISAAQAPPPAAVTASAAGLKGPAKASLFGEDDDFGTGGGGLFAPIKAAAAPASSTTAKPSLFGNDDDLFAPKARPATATTTTTAAPKASLFGTSPGGDLFSAKPAVIAVKPTATAAEPVASSPLVKASSAFSDPLSGSPKGKIAALGAGINFNPAMLAGGGRPAPKAAPVIEARMTEDGGLEISNAGARLGDEATLGAKSKATLRRKGARRAPTRKKAEEDWDEDVEEDDPPVAPAIPTPAVASVLPTPSLAAFAPPVATAPIAASSVPAIFEPVAPVADIFGTPGAGAPPIDIFGDASAAPDIFGDVPSIF